MRVTAAVLAGLIACVRSDGSAAMSEIVNCCACPKEIEKPPSAEAIAAVTLDVDEEKRLARMKAEAELKVAEAAKATDNAARAAAALKEARCQEASAEVALDAAKAEASVAEEAAEEAPKAATEAAPKSAACSRLGYSAEYVPSKSMSVVLDGHR